MSLSLRRGHEGKKKEKGSKEVDGRMRRRKLIRRREEGGEGK